MDNKEKELENRKLNYQTLYKSEKRMEKAEEKTLSEIKEVSREPREHLPLHETLKKKEKDEHAYTDIKCERSSIVKHREELADKKKEGYQQLRKSSTLPVNVIKEELREEAHHLTEKIKNEEKKAKESRKEALDKKKAEYKKLKEIADKLSKENKENMPTLQQLKANRQTELKEADSERALMKGQDKPVEKKEIRSLTSEIKSFRSQDKEIHENLEKKVEEKNFKSRNQQTFRKNKKISKISLN